MNYLEGEHIQINRKSILGILGKDIKYLLNKDIDKSGRGYFFPRIGIIEEVYRNNVFFDDGTNTHINDLKEIILI